MVKEEKVQLRKKILTLLRHQKEEERVTKSLAIAAKLYQRHEYKQANTVLFYASFNGEVNTFNMMRETLRLKKRVVLPSINLANNTITPKFLQSLDDLTEGPYGIKEPGENAPVAHIEEIDMAVVPGIAFDKQNNRLGRGGGYYDRFLKEFPESIPSVGLAYDFQIIEHLPCQKPHDQPVNWVCTN